MSKPEDADASPYAGLAARIRGGKRTADAAEFEERPPSLTIAYRRTANPMRGFSLYRAAESALGSMVAVQCKVELDGAVVGTLAPGQTLQLDTTAGEHRLRILGLAVHSRTRVLQLTNGQRLTFWCCPALTGILFEREH
jgi:hypothetical protein